MDVGDRAPDFSVVTTEGRSFALSDFTAAAEPAQHLVLYFFPKAFTPGCTKEARVFRDHHEEIEQRGGLVLGVSVDDLSVQCDFARENHLSFPLVADHGEQLSRLFGVTRGFLPFNKRVTFILDKAGVVVARFHHEVQVTRHVDDVVAFLAGTSG